MKTELVNIIQFPNLLQNKGDYWKYLSPEFDIYLQNYLKVFEQHRHEVGLIPTKEEWKLLPFGSFSKNSDWKWRRQSLDIIQNLIGDKKFDCVLETGSWNGWLTKHLAQNSETVIATDYFICPFDGIGNVQDFGENIIAVQCNLEEIKSDFKPQSFDFIILNHHLAYMNNPVDYIQQLIPLLKPNGIIISIGNTFFRNPKKKIKANAAFADQFYKKHEMDLYIQPVKGYMDFDNCSLLKDLGFQVKSYPQKFLQNIYSKWNVSAPFYNYLIYNHTT